MQMNLDLTMQPRRRLRRRCTEDFMGNGGTSIQFVIQPPSNSCSSAPWRRDFFIYFQFWVGGKKMKSSSSELLYFVWHEFFWQCRQQAEFDHEEIHSGVEVICEIMICTIKSLLGEWEGTRRIFLKRSRPKRCLAVLLVSQKIYLKNVEHDSALTIFIDLFDFYICSQSS